MSEDPRCCGTGTCIINEDGVCWCGQTWDGEKMCMPIPMAIKVADHDEIKKVTDPSVTHQRLGAVKPHWLYKRRLGHITHR